MLLRPLISVCRDGWISRSTSRPCLQKRNQVKLFCYIHHWCTRRLSIPADFTGTAAGSEIPKSVISIAVLAGALIIGLIIAKCVNVFYDRQSIRDDASDIRYVDHQF